MPITGGKGKQHMIEVLSVVCPYKCICILSKTAIITCLVFFLSGKPRIGNSPNTRSTTWTQPTPIVLITNLNSERICDKMWGMNCCMWDPVLGKWTRILCLCICSMCEDRGVTDRGHFMGNMHQHSFNNMESLQTPY